MKNIYTLTIGILFSLNTFAQGTIMGFSIDPPAPTTADIVKVYVGVQFTSMSCNLDNQGHSTTGSSTSAYAHHCLGMLTAMCNTIDTFNLGMLPAGPHLFDLTLTSGSGGPPCTPGIVPDDQRNTTFTVTLATGISNHNQSSNINIFPNPIHTTATIQINEQLKFKNAEMKIMDVTGRVVKTISAIQNNEFSFDRDKLSDGIYFYQLIQDGSVISNGKLVIE